MAEARKQKKVNELEPDSKSQITMLYENGKPSKVTSIVISTQHKPGYSPEQIKEIVKPFVYNCIPDSLIDNFKDEDFFPALEKSLIQQSSRGRQTKSQSSSPGALSANHYFAPDLEI